MAVTLGQKIKELRREKGLSLEALAQLTDSSKSYLWELENKPVARPSAEKLTRIAEVLEVTPEFLLDESREEPAPNEADQAFYRKYQTLNPAMKTKLKDILRILDEK